MSEHSSIENDEIASATVPENIETASSVIQNFDWENRNTETTVDRLPNDFSVNSLSTASVPSTKTPSRRSVRLGALFPPDKTRFSTFQPQSKTIDLLVHRLQLGPDFISRMEQCGYVKISIIINRFGMDTKTIAKTFAMMGPSYVLDQNIHAETMNLVMFARSQLLKWQFEKPCSKPITKKNTKINASFEKWSVTKYDKLEEFLTDPDNISLAQKEMKMIRSKIRSWINNDAVSRTGTSSTPKIVTTPQQELTRQLENFGKAQTTSSEELKQVVAAMDTRFDGILASLIKTERNTQSGIKDMRATVNQDINIAIDNRLQATMDNRAKDAISRNLAPIMKMNDATPKVVTYEEKSANDHSSINEISVLKEEPDTEGQPPFFMAQLPRTTHKSNKNRRSSFYLESNRQAFFELPKSPLDSSFVVGCNDDLLNPSESSLTSEQRETIRKSRDWMRKAAQDATAKMAVLCTSTITLKRSSLPSSVSWNGVGGKDFEDYIDRITGHIAQQPHMGYLLLDTITQLWFKHGEPSIVLKYGIQHKIHPSLQYVSTSQFILDIVWLFGALQQSLTTRGKVMVRANEHNQDGLIVWFGLMTKFRYGGDVDVYLAKLQQIVAQRYHNNYPGGMMQFLEDYEEAFMNMENVMQRKHQHNPNESCSLYTDDRKRRLFIQNFTVPDLTATLIENVESSTQTWEALVDQLRRRIARRTIHATDAASRRANQALVGTPPSDQSTQRKVNQAYVETPHGYQGQYMPTELIPSYNLDDFDLSTPRTIMAAVNSPAFVCALSADWKVGFELWRRLTSELKSQLSDVRDQHLPPNSGGAKYQNKINEKPKDGPKHGNKDIIQAPAANTGTKIPMQYSANQTQDKGQIDLEDENVKTFLSTVNSIKCNVTHNLKAHTQYLAMLVSYSQDLCIPDGGADSHVGGRTWLPLSPLSGPNVKFANVTGFDEEAAKKFGLPIIAAVLNTVNTEGKEILVRAKHLIFNASSPHTLLSTYQIRELGVIVDDVSKRHLKDEDTNGTHSISFP